MTTMRITITVKKDIHDPAGVAVKQALLHSGLSHLVDVRIGKVIDLCFKDHKDKTCVEVEHVAKSFLSNPIVEDFSIEELCEKSHGK